MIIDLSSSLLHYFSCALVVVLPALGVSLGQGYTTMAVADALDHQPHAHNEISRTFGIAMALIETAAILSFIVALKLFSFGTHAGWHNAQYIHYAEFGIACALGLAGGAAGFFSSLPARQTCLAIARQPFFTSKIQLLMVITQSLIQTPVLLGFILSFLIIGQLESVTGLADALRLLSAGLCLGIGSIGPVLGLARLSQQACEGIGKNKNAYGKILSFSIVSSALIESAIIFCLIIALFLLSAKTMPTTNGLMYLSSALAMGCGTLGVGISSGRLTAQACKVFAEKPELYTEISKISFFSQILIETSAVYALVISIFILL